MDFSGNPAKIPSLGFTHGGRFHADDVFSSALLRILRPDIRIYRGMEVPKGFSGIAFDIGNGPFDHHAKNSPRRKNGIPYAAFGLLWQEYGHFFLPEEEAARFDDKFISPLDLDDNTGSGNQLAGLIGAFNPVWDSDEDVDKAFFEVVDIAETMLRRKLESLISVVRGSDAVKKALETMKDNILVFENYIPWKPVVVPSSAEFVIFPSERGGYSLQCVPKDFTAKAPNKVPLPAAWCGRSPEDLAKISGIEDLRFCHSSGFMAAVGSLEGAYKAIEKARKLAAQQAEQRAKAAEENAARLAAEKQKQV